MLQQVLDPRVTNGARTWTPSAPLPPDLRRFGCFPDFSALLPGDLLLVSALEPPAASRAIMAFQEKGGYHRDDARWHHAAMYFGEGLGNCLCEAVAQEGVRLATLYEYVGSHLLRFRRDPAIEISTRWRIVVEGLCRLGHSYSKARIAELAGQAIQGYWREKAAGDGAAVICSEFYARAYSLATRKPLRNPVGEEATPAYLSCCAELVDVAVGWLRIGGQ